MRSKTKIILFGKTVVLATLNPTVAEVFFLRIPASLHDHSCRLLLKFPKVSHLPKNGSQKLEGDLEVYCNASMPRIRASQVFTGCIYKVSC